MNQLQEILDTKLFLMSNSKWLWLLISFILFSVIYILGKKLFLSLKSKISLEDKDSFAAYFLKSKIEKGLSWILACLFGYIFLDNLELTPVLTKYLSLTLKVILSLNLLRLAYFAADASGQIIDQVVKGTDTTMSHQIAPLATKTLRILVVIIGSLIILDNFGVNVTALLAGLGIGGVALAFAAQDTVANVFGTITILFDSSFKIGDRIKLGSTEGFVEDVGFRSTRIRTFYNSIVVIPNSIIAKETIDNMTLRCGICRFRHTFSFTYSTPTEALKQFKEKTYNYLKQNEKVDPERILVQFSELGENSLNVLINFHFFVAETENELELMHNYLTTIYEMAISLKLEFAFPTRTLILENKNQQNQSGFA